MPKYYVDAGQLRLILDRPTPKQAAIDAFKTLETTPVEYLHSAVVVSEVGFDANNAKDLFFSTMDILEQSDQVRNYKPKDCL